MTNFILDVYSKLWTLLNAHAPVAAVLKAANEVRTDQGKQYPRNLGAKQPTDFPRIELSTGNITGQWSEADRVFATLDEDFDPTQGGWLENITQAFDVKIVHEACDLSVNSPLIINVLTALRLGGPKMGFAYVLGWSYSVRDEKTTKGAAAGKLRQITTITVSVQMQFEGRELVV